MKRQLMASTCFAAMLFTTGGAYAAEDAAGSAGSSNVEDVTVFGAGQSRQVQTVDGKELQIEVPGASPLQLVNKLPNVNFQHADAFGSYEWSARITIRGFNQSQLGFTLDDVPLGDMTYGNHNGLHISRAISSENVGQAELAQGAGALETASDSNLGGTLKFTSRTPSDAFGIYTAGTYGSWNMWRGFARLDTGTLATGARAYLSLADQTADKWKGSGPQKTLQANFKIEQPIGQGVVTAWINGSERRETDYQDMSLEMIQRLGRNWDNIHDFKFAEQLAEIGANRGEIGASKVHPEVGTVYPGKITNVDDAYFNSTGLRNDLIGAVTLDLPVNEILSVHATAYGHHDRGLGTWATYVPSPNYGVAGATTDNSPLSLRATNYHLTRAGFTGGATLTLGTHSLNAGLWYEDNSFEQARQFYGLNLGDDQRNFLSFQSNPFRTQWNYDFGTTTMNFYVQDTWTVNDDLTVNFGAKSFSVKNEVRTISAEPGQDKNGNIAAKDGFLPQAGFRYDFSPDSEVFGSYARNIRAFSSSGTSGPFSATQASFNSFNHKLKPESTDTFELGWRYHEGDFQGVVAAYHVNFQNRLASVTSGAGILGNFSVISNVGAVTANGFETAGTWSFRDHWSLFASYAYNDSKYDDDAKNGDGTVAVHTAGKTTVDTPKNLFKSELAYDNGVYYAKLGMSYLSKRFFSYENDQSVPSQTLFDLTAGYRISSSNSVLNDVEVQLNVSNLFDEEFISTIDSNGFSARGDNQSLLPGAPREVFISIHKLF